MCALIEFVFSGEIVSLFVVFSFCVRRGDVDLFEWQKLKEKAAFRNPDEFYFKMIKTRSVGGVHRPE